MTIIGPHPFTLRQLQYVVAIADTGGFRRAARACHVSQPSLSAQVAQLEGALGVRLFERRGRRVLVTSAGEALLPLARRALAAADDLARSARGLGDPFSGTWRIGVIPTVAPYLLPAVAPALRTRFPALRAQWVEDKTRVLVERLARGDLDAAILATGPELDGFAHAVLARDPFVLALPPGHPLDRGVAPVRERELVGTSVLLLDDGHCLRDQALAVCGQVGAQELGFRATSLPTLAQMVAGGAGVTLLPTLAVSTEAPRAGLSIRPFADPAPARTIAIAWRESSPLGPALPAFAEGLRAAWPAR